MSEEVQELTQRISEVKPTHVQVTSNKGNQYWVKLSDVVKMTMTPEEGDLAVIRTFESGWLVVDLVKYYDTLDEIGQIRVKIKEGRATEEEKAKYDAEVKKQRQSLNDLMGDY